MPETTEQEKIAILRKWPKVVAHAFIGWHTGKPRYTWDEFAEAQDRFEEVLRGMRPKSECGETDNG